MLFGINTFLFQSPFTTGSLGLLEKFREWGFDSVEIALENVSDLDIRKLKKALRDNGLVCGSICGAFGPGRDLRGSRQEQQNAIDYIKGVMDIMAEIDCPVMGGPLYSAVGRAEAVEPDEYKNQWYTVAKHLQSLAGYAKQSGIKLAIEPLNRYETDFINTCEQAMKMVHDVNSDALGIHLDTYHMNIEEKDSAKAIIDAGQRLALLHACGCDRGTPGNDHIDWMSIAPALHLIQYDGSVVIESFTPDVKVIAKAASIWRKMEPSQEDIAVEGLKFLREIL